MILLILRHRSTLTLPLFYTFNSWCIWSKNYPIGQISHFGYTYFFCLLPGVRRVLLAFVWVCSRNGQAPVVAHVPSEQRRRRVVRLCVPEAIFISPIGLPYMTSASIQEWGVKDTYQFDTWLWRSEVGGITNAKNFLDVILRSSPLIIYFLLFSYIVHHIFSLTIFWV